MTRIEDHCVIGLFMETWDTLSQVINMHVNSSCYSCWLDAWDVSCKHCLHVCTSSLQSAGFVHHLQRKPAFSTVWFLLQLGVWCTEAGVKYKTAKDT